MIQIFVIVNFESLDVLNSLVRYKAQMVLPGFVVVTNISSHEDKKMHRMRLNLTFSSR